MKGADRSGMNVLNEQEITALMEPVEPVVMAVQLCELCGRELASSHEKETSNCLPCSMRQAMVLDIEEAHKALAAGWARLRAQMRILEDWKRADPPDPTIPRRLAE